MQEATLAMFGLSTTDVGAILGLLTPLVVVPLGGITFSLRALRDQQIHGRRDMTRRIENTEAGVRRLDARAAAFERDYASKEDWLRESMLARKNIERLFEAVVRIEAARAPVTRPNPNKPDAILYEGTD